MKHLTRALDGQNQWWKYFLVFFVALFIGQFVGAIPLVIAMVVAQVMNGGEFVKPDNNLDLTAYGIDSNLGLVLLIIPFIVSLILAILLIKSFHYRNYKDVINGGFGFRWNRFWTGVIVWGAIALVLLLAELVLNPGNLELQFNPAAFIPLVIISLLLIPIQSGTEEFLFRGYLAQGVAAWTRKPWLVILIPSLFFALVHAMNPEVKEYGFWIMMPNYLVFGIVFAIMAYLDDGIELAIGTHAVNNCFSSIFVTSKSSALQTSALFYQEEINPANEFVVLVISAAIMLMIYTMIFKWDYRVLTQKIEKIETKKDTTVPGVGATVSE